MVLHDTRHHGSIAVSREVGISLRQLYYWVSRLHVVRPQLQQHGRRRFRSFTTRDVQKLKAVKRLVERGYTLQAAVRAVKHA